MVIKKWLTNSKFKKSTYILQRSCNLETLKQSCILQKRKEKKTFPSDNFNIDSKNVIPIKYILIDDIQIKQDVLKYKNNY